jgi:peptidoglycan/xylan/chitin deacetylase (PgdA/CDA1 family)
MDIVEQVWDRFANFDHRFRIADFLPNGSNVILKYHSVGLHSYSGLSPTKLRSDLSYLSDRYEIVDLPEVIDSLDNSTKRIALTFDDGYRDFYTRVLPILDSLNVPATVFLISHTLEHPSFNHAQRSSIEFSYVTKTQAKTLASHPLVTIGNHTKTHPYLDEVEPGDELHSEIVGAKDYLESTLNTTVDRFCYPAGRLSDAAQATVASTHRYAVTTQPRLIPSNPNIHRLPRLNGPRHNITWAVSDVAQRLRTSQIAQPWIS